MEKKKITHQVSWGLFSLIAKYRKLDYLLRTLKTKECESLLCGSPLHLAHLCSDVSISCSVCCWCIEKGGSGNHDKGTCLVIWQHTEENIFLVMTHFEIWFVRNIFLVNLCGTKQNGPLIKHKGLVTSKVLLFVTMPVIIQPPQPL